MRARLGLGPVGATEMGQKGGGKAQMASYSFSFFIFIFCFVFPFQILDSN
jgi:hypothetical protein